MNRNNNCKKCSMKVTFNSTVIWNELHSIIYRIFKPILSLQCIPMFEWIRRASSYSDALIPPDHIWMIWDFNRSQIPVGSFGNNTFLEVLAVIHNWLENICNYFTNANFVWQFQWKGWYIINKQKISQTYKFQSSTVLSNKSLPFKRVNEIFWFCKLFSSLVFPITFYEILINPQETLISVDLH